MQSIVAAILGPFSSSEDYGPLLKWILINTLAVIGLLVLWFFGLLQEMIETDRTRISLIILAIFVATALHCLYQTIIVSRELVKARKVRDAIAESGGRSLRVVDGRVMTATGETLEPGVMTNHIADLMAKGLRGEVHLDQTLLLRSLADQLRAREKLGWFVSESLLRLALLGTAVGFILMLIPITGLDSFDVSSLRTTLTGMTEGMAIALNVTVTGIATALLLKFEYYLLDEGIADLFRIVTETTEVHVVPSLEPKVGSAPAAALSAAVTPAITSQQELLPSSDAGRLAATDNRVDDLTKLTGIGPRLQQKLNDHGIEGYDQIAAWTAADVERIDRELELKGRIARDDWVGQARALVEPGSGRA